MYALVRTGNKQYRVAPNDVLEVESLSKKEGTSVTLKDVLLVDKDGEVLVGSPLVKNASVVCEVLGDMREKKIISFKFRRRENYRRKIGHRQLKTRLLVKEIVLKAE
jgi:large subunit ribosomal protein L21